MMMMIIQFIYDDDDVYPIMMIIRPAHLFGMRLQYLPIQNQVSETEWLR